MTIEKIDEWRGCIEREWYWCEDCQREVTKAEAGNPEEDVHLDHEVVAITVVAGHIGREMRDQIEILREARKGKTPDQAQS